MKSPKSSLSVHQPAYVARIRFSRTLADKSSAADPMPTNVLKQVVDLVAPFIVELFNRSPNTGHFPNVFRQAFITPVVKKANLDVNNASSCRPISNLSVLSKVLELLVVRQLMNYLTSEDLLPTLQSRFRAGHSTETAVLRVLSDIIEAVDRGDMAALVLLDLLAASVDHGILLQRLQVTCGIDDVAHRWIRSYLSDRTQHVRRGPNKSTTTCLICGVPQGSVLGPILFVLYTVDHGHTDRKPWLIGPSLRRQHAGSRIVSAFGCSSVFHETHQLRGRDVRVDEVQQTAVKPRQGRGSVMCNQPAPASTADHRTANRRSCSRPSEICA